MSFVFFQVVRALVQQAMSQVQQLLQKTTEVGKVLDQNAKAVQTAWIGGDAEQMLADHQRKITTGFANVCNIFSGFNSNLTRAVQIVDECERKCKSIVSKLGDEFRAI
jgi:hypothetical protein